VEYWRHSGHHIGQKNDARHHARGNPRSIEEGVLTMKFRHVPARVRAMPGLAPEIDNIVAFVAAAKKQEPEDQAAESQ
jgi:hypothetical protein